MLAAPEQVSVLLAVLRRCAGINPCRVQQLPAIPRASVQAEQAKAMQLRQREEESARTKAVAQRIAFPGRALDSHGFKQTGRQIRYEIAFRSPLIPGEIIDWTVVSYIRDAAQLGMHKALIQTGHFNLEEPGMQYMAEKLAGLVPELPVQFIPSGDPYYFV